MQDPIRENIDGTKRVVHRVEHSVQWGYLIGGLGLLALAFVLYSAFDAGSDGADSDDSDESATFL